MNRRQHRKYARRCPAAVRDVAGRLGHLAACVLLEPPFLAVFGIAMWRMKC